MDKILVRHNKVEYANQFRQAVTPYSYGYGRRAPKYVYYPKPLNFWSDKTTLLGPCKFASHNDSFRFWVRHESEYEIFKDCVIFKNKWDGRYLYFDTALFFQKDLHIIKSAICDHNVRGASHVNKNRYKYIYLSNNNYIEVSHHCVTMLNKEPAVWGICIPFNIFLDIYMDFANLCGVNDDEVVFEFIDPDRD